MTCFYFGCAFARHLDGSIYLYTAQFHYFFNTPFPCCSGFGRGTWHEYKLSLLCLPFVLFEMENLGSLHRWKPMGVSTGIRVTLINVRIGPRTVMLHLGM